MTLLASPTGTLYVNQLRDNTSVFLFARLRSDDRAFLFLGPATYVRHAGERPIVMTWRLAHRLPADLFTTFAAAVLRDLARSAGGRRHSRGCGRPLGSGCVSTR